MTLYHIDEKDQDEMFMRVSLFAAGPYNAAKLTSTLSTGIM